MTVTDFRQRVLSWFQQNGRMFPWRCGTIEPRIGLLTELLLRKTTAEQVAKNYSNLVACLKIFLSSGKREELVLALKPLGLYKQRLTAIEEIVTYLNNNYLGQLPPTLDQLLKIPHVGPYIANATRCFYFNQPAPIVDVNVARLLGRFFGLQGSKLNPVRTKAYWLIAAVLLPKNCTKEYNWGLLDLGALVCTSRQPNCSVCPLSIGCSYDGFFNWCGLSESEVQELKTLNRDIIELPLRLAEMLGLSYVPPIEKVLRLILHFNESLEITGTLRELDIRRFVVHSYFDPSLQEKLAWIYKSVF
ncbi:hypothetical protein V3F56_09060 [Moorellaceae bacterium AZ2]